ncbi:D-2-hydroxyacid dehydrogenase [Shewanella dokdonensis]|uniref:D-2-hydroxyacid dehydrogenase n=1 Tax=Shewanella dokdonensis TaxID=712036 RepID=A0ABX8DBX4_9GAMM|nr:D-2-hydroxyacid dehydrogenase [Shewanella dokdonensis]MCL1074798.1 D-2-hydroxyacid dehydrogenase [Shewanella dokdonensis]QVK22226.1 D-2-hydroxyacid dehydrogenase [Shewanella dokdonensis]
MVHKLLLLTRENCHYQTLLQQLALPELMLLDDAPTAICEADIWLAEPALAAPLLPLAHKLQWLQSTFAGVDKLLTSKSRQDYQLSNIKGIFGPLMSEYVFGYLLAHCRQQQLYREQQQQGLWAPAAYRSLQNQTMLLLGTGSIGSHIATTAQHFGMKTIGMNRSGRPTASFHQIISEIELAQALADADVVVNTLPASAATTEILSAERLNCLKQGALLFNIGRGSAINLLALHELLLSRPDVTAILDVFPQEPLPANHDLWRQNNAIITPHISAPSFPKQVVQIFADNYQRWRCQQPLQYLVDFNRGY